MNPLRRTLNSAFLMTATFLLGFDAILTGVLPQALPVWYDTNFPLADSKCAKVVNYIESSNDPTVILLGSSLIRTAAQGADTNQTDDPKDKLANNYDKADYFKNLLEKQFSANVSVLNLAMRGCMASDYGLILQRSNELGKNPKFVICGTAPAEFLSNDQPVVKNTFVYQCLENHKFSYQQSPFTVAWNEACRFNEAHGQHALETILTYARRNSTNWLCAETGHPPDMYSFQQRLKNALKQKQNVPVATEQALTELSAPADTDHSKAMARATVLATADNPLGDLEQFRTRYNPPNYKLYNEHMQNFEAMLKFNHEHAVPLVIVNMPVTDPNKSLMPSGILEKYHADMERLTTKYQISYLNMDAPNSFSLSDFHDSTHLNAKGARKFFVALSKRLATESDLMSIAQNRNNRAL